MKIKKILAFIVMPFCFAWFIQTLIWFWEEMAPWSAPDSQYHGSMILYPVMFLFGRNLLTLFMLFLCSRAFKD